MNKQTRTKDDLAALTVRIYSVLLGFFTIKNVFLSTSEHNFGSMEDSLYGVAECSLVGTVLYLQGGSIKEIS